MAHADRRPPLPPHRGHGKHRTHTNPRDPPPSTHTATTQPDNQTSCFVLAGCRMGRVSLYLPGLPCRHFCPDTISLSFSLVYRIRFDVRLMQRVPVRFDTPNSNSSIATPLLEGCSLSVLVCVVHRSTRVSSAPSNRIGSSRSPVPSAVPCLHAFLASTGVSRMTTSMKRKHRDRYVSDSLCHVPRTNHGSVSSRFAIRSLVSRSQHRTQRFGNDE